MRCNTCGALAGHVEDCTQARGAQLCLAPSNRAADGSFYLCERPLHHRGRCAAVVERKSETYITWQESAAELYADLGLPLRGEYRDLPPTGGN